MNINGDSKNMESRRANTVPKLELFKEIRCFKSIEKGHLEIKCPAKNKISKEKKPHRCSSQKVSYIKRYSIGALSIIESME